MSKSKPKLTTIIITIPNTLNPNRDALKDEMLPLPGHVRNGLRFHDHQFPNGHINTMVNTHEFTGHGEVALEGYINWLEGRYPFECRYSYCLKSGVFRIRPDIYSKAMFPMVEVAPEKV